MNEFDRTILLKTRARRLRVAKQIGDILGTRFLLAGGALTKDDNPKDFDIYGVDAPIPIYAVESRVLCHEATRGYLSKTANAITVNIYGQTVQFCSYFKPTPQETVAAFDFAHCMAGAVFGADGSIENVVATDDFWLSESNGTTWYTNSEYPLSSLMRLMKFHKRGLFEGDTHKSAAVSILCDIVERGFKNNDDFFDQCASISESFQDYNSVDADYLYSLLHKEWKN